MSEPSPPATATRRDALRTAGAGLLALSGTGLPAPAEAAETEWLSVRDFGARGDGVTDDGPALIRMRDYMQRDRGKHYTAFFPPGHYTYINNRWIANLGALTIDAHGCKFQCIRTNGFGSDQRPFSTQSIFWNLGNDTYRSTLTYHTGFLFETARAGAGAIRLLDPTDAEQFIVGKRVLLHGFDQQWGGYPYNLRYFQWNRIAGVDAATGVLTLEDRLTYDFRDDWRDMLWNPTKGEIYGRSRIMLLERPEFHYARLIQIHGVEFLRNPFVSLSDSNGLVLAAERLVMQDISHEDGFLWPSECRDVLYERSMFHRVSGDKLCDRVVFRNCRVRAGFREFSGVNDLLVEDSEFDGVPVQVSPRQLTMRRNRIRVPAAYQFGGIQTYGLYPVRSMVCEDNEIVHDGALRYGINTENAVSVTVAGVGALGQLLLDDIAGRPAVQRLEAGFIVYRPDMSFVGRVTEIDWDGAHHVLAGDWPTPPQVGEALLFFGLRQLRETGTRISGGACRVIGNMRAPQLVANAGEATRLTLGEPLPFAAGYERHEVLGNVVRVALTVSEPYSGPDSSPMLYVNLISASTIQVLAYRLRQAGHVETSVHGTVSNAGIATLVALDPAFRTRTVEILYRQGGSPISGTADQMPVLSLEFDVTSL